MSEATKMPSHRVYAVLDKAKAGAGKSEEVWVNLGVAYEHVSGDGYNVLLGGVPTSRKLILREIDEGDLGLFGKRQDVRIRRWAFFHILDDQARRIVLWVAGLLALQSAIVISVLLWWR